MPKGDHVWQHSEACQQRMDTDGNRLRQTDGKIQDKAIEREVDALENTERFQSHTRAVDDLHQAPGRDFNLVVGQKYNSEGVNLFQVVCDTLDLLQHMNTQLAAHTHLPGPAPSLSDAAAFTAKAIQTTALAAKLKPITL